MKKIMALTLMLMMFVSTVCFAAVSSSGSKSSAPSSSKSSTSAPSSSQTAPSGSYKPTAPASSYSNTAPAKQTIPSTQQNTQPQSSTSSFWRNASMIGGGMLAGSLLGNMFGNSSGNMGGESSIFGMLINLLMVGGTVIGIRYLWNKYKNRNRDM